MTRIKPFISTEMLPPQSLNYMHQNQNAIFKKKKKKIHNAGITCEHGHEVRTAGSQDISVTVEFRFTDNERNVAQQPHLALFIEALEYAQTVRHL